VCALIEGASFVTNYGAFSVALSHRIALLRFQVGKLKMVGVGGFEPPIPVALFELALLELCESGVLDQLDHTPVGWLVGMS
jgi:hypothetical protein